MHKTIIIAGLTALSITGYCKTNSHILKLEDVAQLPLKLQQEIKSQYPEAQLSIPKGVVSTVATIGGDGGCDFNSSVRTTPIQDAIDSQSVTYTELRIVEDVYDEENITLEDRNMIIKGGYATCADAANDVMSSPDSLSTIIQSSTDSNPVFKIQGNTGNNQVNFYNLTITNSGASNWFGGAFRINNADANVTLNNIALTYNNGLRGGAIAVAGDSGNTTVYLNGVSINNNSALEGGGLFCNNPTAKITINSSTGLTHGIYSNNATDGDGGGVLVTNGCEFISYQGTKDFQLFGDDLRGINFNSATGNGGGLAVLNGSSAQLYGRNSCVPFQNFWLCLFGNNTDPVNLLLNTADSDDTNDGGMGGAIYVSGPGSELIAENTMMTANFANEGGAVATEDEAVAIIKSAFENEAGSIPCWQPGGCSEINSNFAENFGGGLYADSASETYVINTQVKSNRSDTGTAGYTRDNNSKLNFEGSLIFNNGDDGSGDYNDLYVLRSYNSSNLSVYYSTIADNFSTSHVITNYDARVELYKSIIHESNNLPIYLEAGINNPTRVIDCLVTHEQDSLTATRVLVTDPKFTDRDNQDYTLVDNSPAIDYCDTQWVAPLYTDIQGNARNIDLPVIPDVYGSVDAGAYENVSSDIIFINGFD